MTKKGQALVNLGQFGDETPLNSMQIYSFWNEKIPKKNQKGHSVRVTHAIAI